MAQRIMALISKSQIDRLGDRLKKKSLGEADLRLLDDYRRSFRRAYEWVLTTIKDQLQLEPTGRPAKSTLSIIDKLRREKIRLSQVQDIAGCRLVVANAVLQAQTLAALQRAFPDMKLVDRRLRPSHGYRAVHAIVVVDGVSVEIQVRSLLQQLWAEFSERLSDSVDAALKYGGGPKTLRQGLYSISKDIAELEKIERRLHALTTQTAGKMNSAFQEVFDNCEPMNERVEELRSKIIAQFEAPKW